MCRKVSRDRKVTTLQRVSEHADHHVYLVPPLTSVLVVVDEAEDLQTSEVQAIIESTPELDMDLDGCRGTRCRPLLT